MALNDQAYSNSLLNSGPKEGSFIPRSSRKTVGEPIERSNRGMQIRIEKQSNTQLVVRFIHDILSSSCAICSRVASSSSSSWGLDEEERERKATTDLRASRVRVTPRSLSFCCARLIRCWAVGGAMAALFLSLSLHLSISQCLFSEDFWTAKSFPAISQCASM